MKPQAGIVNISGPHSASFLLCSLFIIFLRNHMSRFITHVAALLWAATQVPEIRESFGRKDLLPFRG